MPSSNPAPPGNGERPERPKSLALFAKLKRTLSQPRTEASEISTQSPDGETNDQAKALSDPSQPVDLVHTILQQAKSGKLGADLKTALHALQQLTAPPIDDRKLLLEEVIQTLSGLPSNSAIGTTVSDTLIGSLWQDLVRLFPSIASQTVANLMLKPHPPATYLGNEFRTADGSGNNLDNPDLGKSGTPSSYLDLSPLYGNNQTEQNTVRSFEQGELWPDCWASDRLGLMPPHVAALLVVFSRNHNFIARKLFSINEAGKFKPVGQLDTDGKKAQDERLFQTARLINCGFFVNVVFYDYIRSQSRDISSWIRFADIHLSRVILNNNRTESTWALFPNNVIKNLTGGSVPRGVGNACSIEFNILYRWHSAISAEDEEWTNQLFKKLLPDKTFDEMTEADFVSAMTQLGRAQGTDVRRWTFGELKRQGPDGYGPFRDSDISDLLTKATESVAGAFRGGGTPACMRIIDVLGMAIARQDWKACSLNEFRKFLHLKPFDTFQDWNPDSKIWRAAENLYTHIDNLELFPGLTAEQAKPSMPGSGLAPGYTISRAILSDAVALVRGDRYFTTEFNPASLTDWGFEDVHPDVTGGSFGGVLGKILMRTLPTSYSFNSIYALFPFSTPETTKAILLKLGIADKYDFSKPVAARPKVPAFTYAGCLSILTDHETFGVVYGPSIKQLVGNDYGFFIGFNNIEDHTRDREILSKALFLEGWESSLKQFYESTTKDLIKAKSWSFGQARTFHLDVVRDVTNLVSVYWVASAFGVPLKTDPKTYGLTPQELYSMLSVLFTFIFLNSDPVHGFALKDAALSQSKLLGAIVAMRFSKLTGASTKQLEKEVRAGLPGLNLNAVALSQEARAFYSSMIRSKRPLEQLISSTLATMTASVANQGQVAAHVINFYLAPEQRNHYDVLVELANESSDVADSKIWSYILEVMRLDPQTPGIPRVATANGSFKDGDKDVEFSQGDIMFASMQSCGRDPLVFPNPDEVDVTRDQSLYKVFGSGMHSCVGSQLVRVSMVAMIREFRPTQVFKLKNLRRAAGAPGQLYRFTENIADTPYPVYISAQASTTPYPVSLGIIYDA
ncbi:linoleate 10R-lipoxygenase, partial [Phenoliferia sp. Uapishka_3]